ncbi:MAG: zinc ribbon domain-containing protein [Candidatus Marinimicrobia bacterium]|nr:zinc ribbon domain-containing protein [Candidatus Neomarinimicrobiota bacterium]MBL7023364.1 zinc ribbon domain-containing protein [Candidatus Neomarinimicrobiota bacterium]MBL7109323.1 zinc ribbon domain-containing protein [Candidatus Neomarinimicrobiota bacterium]
MPTYNYKCNQCSDVFSVKQSIKDEPLKLCESCGGEVRRLISGNTGIIFKGSGFYLTDYSRKSTVQNNSKSEPKKDVSKNKTKLTKKETK